MNIWKYILSNICLTIITSELAYALTAEDYLITSLPGININALPFDQYAGHIEVSPETNGNLFFWMLEQEKAKTTNKLIFWLNGGPGCSSMDGMFLENGPYRVNPDLTLSVNPGGWQDQATIVFLDQPVGTGFSYANGNGFMHNLDQIADEFIVFLDKFMEVFPYLQERELYIAGESFAGTYIPYFARNILDINKSERKTKYNLKGLAIGNGWIAPLHQYRAYVDFSTANNLITGEFKKKADEQLIMCEKEIQKESLINVDMCENIMDTILKGSRLENGDCVNIYDIRLRNETWRECGRTWPHELVFVEKYLKTPELKLAIHSQNQVLGWQECSGYVSRALNGDKSKPSYDLLPDILKEINVLLFSGERDLICNHIGTEYLISNMTWNNGDGLEGAEEKDWYVNDKIVGTYTEARGLTYVLIKDGSHMVPYDKPTETLDMINRFMGIGDNSVKGLISHVGKPSTTIDVDVDGNEDEEDEKKQPVIENEDLENSLNGNGGDKGDDEDDDDDDDDDKENDSDANTNPGKTPSTDEDHVSSDEDDSNENNNTSNSATNQLTDYAKSNGSYGALILLLIVAVAGCCWYKSRSNNDDNRNKSSSSRSGLWDKLQQFFGSNKNNDGTKLRLADQDEANELDELVVDGPTLFSAEGYSDDDEERSQHGASHPNNNHGSNTAPQKSTRFAIVDDDTDDGFDDFADWDQDNDAEEIIRKKD
ncbi:unnamed protein product [Cunninghamella blakesleeana]